MWIERLTGLNVIVSGDFRPSLGLTQPEVQSLIESHGARIHRDVSWGTTLLIRADRGFVFCLPDGRAYHPERVSREFDRRVARLQLPRITLHGLRHTWATLALRAGVHPKVVQERLGHSTIGVTLNTYSHVSAGMQSDAADKVAGLIFGSA